jgi:hypothetical protein
MKIIPFVAVVLAATLHGADVQPIPPQLPAESWQMTSADGGQYRPAPSRIEELLYTVRSRVLVNTTAGQWDSGAVHAVFTAFEITDPVTDGTERGLRIELSRPGVSETVFVDEAVFSALHRVMASYTARLPKAEDCVPGNMSGLRLSWLWDSPRRLVHPFNTAVYFDSATEKPGMILGRGFKTAGFKGNFMFPGTLPSDFDKVLDAAESSFGHVSAKR